MQPSIARLSSKIILPFDVIDVPQGSEEWLDARIGRVTGSNASHVMSKPLPSGGEPAGKSDYRLQLALERITRRSQMDDFSNKYTRHGTEMEPMARVSVEERTGIVFNETGFCRHREKQIGVSLDGSTSDFKTMLELKCPKPKTHFKYIEANKLPAEYRWQIIHGMYVTGAQKCLFASYDENMPDGMDLFLKWSYAKDMPLEEYGVALDAFLLSVDQMVLRVMAVRERMMNEK